MQVKYFFRHIFHPAFPWLPGNTKYTLDFMAIKS